MPDNPSVPWLSQPVAADDVSGNLVQRVKLQLGGDGGASDAPGGSTYGLLVDVSRVQGTSPLTASAPTAATVGTASAQAVAANAARKGCILTNTSPNWISLGFGVPAVLYSGICLAPNGGSYAMGEKDFTTAQIRAIASGAGSNLAIQEFV